MPYQVIAADGRVIELDDDEVVPPGCSLSVPVQFMDAEQRANVRATAKATAPFAISDHAAQRVRDAYADFKQRTGAGMHRHRVPTEPPDEMADGEERFDRRAASYDAMKKRLGTKAGRGGAAT